MPDSKLQMLEKALLALKDAVVFLDTADRLDLLARVAPGLTAVKDAVDAAKKEVARGH